MGNGSRGQRTSENCIQPWLSSCEHVAADTITTTATMSSQDKTQQPLTAPSSQWLQPSALQAPSAVPLVTTVQGTVTWTAPHASMSKIITRKALSSELRNRYDFIHRNITKGDVFVHQTTIKNKHKTFTVWKMERLESVMLLKEKRQQCQRSCWSSNAMQQMYSKPQPLQIIYIAGIICTITCQITSSESGERLRLWECFNTGPPTSDAFYPTVPGDLNWHLHSHTPVQKWWGHWEAGCKRTR